MAMLKIKLIVCLICAFFIAMLLLGSQSFSIINSQSAKAASVEIPKTNLKPENALIERFNLAIQQRFLTELLLGMRRIVPAVPPSPHLEYFSPVNDEEKLTVAAFEKEGLEVSLYLFGRHANPKIVDGKEQKKFTVNYRLNKPLPVTANLTEKQLPAAAKMLKYVKAAFIEFQTPNSLNENTYEFSDGKWSYIAKPVRAVNQSCLKCHTDYVITEKIGDGQYKFRKRKVGDANGVIVYGFARRS